MSKKVWMMLCILIILIINILIETEEEDENPVQDILMTDGELVSKF